MIIILDISVLISIFATKGNSFAKDILELAAKGRTKLAVSNETFEEFGRKVRSEKVKSLPGFQGNKVGMFIAWYKYNSLIFNIKNISIRTSLRDPQDIIYLQLAKVSKASYLVSLDKDLLEIKRFSKTQIVSPKEFMDDYLNNT